MVRRHPRLRRNVRKQPTLIRKYPPHASLRRFAIEKLNQQIHAMARGFFSKLLVDRKLKSLLNACILALRAALKSFLKQAGFGRTGTTKSDKRLPVALVLLIRKIR